MGKRSTEVAALFESKKMMKKKETHVAALVRDIVRQLELVEGDDFRHPLLAGARAVGVDVHPLGHLGIGFASSDPTTENRSTKLTIRKEKKSP
jgi:hypothetical protein